MLLKHRLLLITTMLLTAHLSYAATDGCGERGAAIVQHAYPKAKSTDNGSFIVNGAVITLASSNNMDSIHHVMICKTWPAYPQRLLVAVPLITKASDDENQGDLELLVLDNTTLKVEQRLALDGRMSDDAIQISGVALDTARYQLAPDSIAFGLRLTRTNNSHISPFEEVDLWLYVIDHGQLHSVLNGIVTSHSHSDLDTNCARTFDETNRTLAVDSATHNGYADLLVTEKSSSRVLVVDKAGRCDEKIDNGKKQSYRLGYDGKTYAVPKVLQPLR